MQEKSTSDNYQDREIKEMKEQMKDISKHFNIITQTEVVRVVKARLFCKYLKGSSLRIVYSYFDQKQRIELIELYFKGNKENEDRERIKKYLKNIS